MNEQIAYTTFMHDMRVILFALVELGRALVISMSMSKASSTKKIMVICSMASIICDILRI